MLKPAKRSFRDVRLWSLEPLIVLAAFLLGRIFMSKWLARAR